VKKGKLFVFSAPSGTGKTTIVRYVLNQFNEMVFSVSATTRPKRGNEIEGKDYFFLTEEDFNQRIDRSEFIEWEKFYDYLYGTIRDFVENHISNGRSLALEVDVKGALKIKKEYSDAVLVFIAPPSLEELKRRLINRNTESDSDLQKRIERSELELSYMDKFDYKVINNKLEEAKKEVIRIVESELFKEV
jgi:guanylate kinase